MWRWVIVGALILVPLLAVSGTVAQQPPGGQMPGGQMPGGQMPRQREPAERPGQQPPPMMGQMGDMTPMMTCAMMMMGAEMRGGGAADPKVAGRMLQMRGEMLRAMGEILQKHGKAMEEGK